MKTVVAVFSKNAYREYILPEINNSDHRIFMDKDYYYLKESYELILEVSDHIWSILPDAAYQIFYKDSRLYTPVELKNKNIFMLTDLSGEKVYLMIRQEEMLLYSFRSFDLKGIREIYIGSLEDCDIVYTYNNIISKRHALLKLEGDTFILYSLSGNGTYVNNNQVKKQIKLNFGDYINILGLKLLFLDRLLAVDLGQEGNRKNVIVKLRRVEDSYEDGEDDLKVHDVMPLTLMDSKVIYKIARRSVVPFELPKRQICPPPYKKDEDRKGYYDNVGPALTMMIPMMIGYSMMIYGSKLNGDGNNLSSYAGLIMVLLSCLVSVYWAARNTRTERRKSSNYELKRVAVYESYLKKEEEEIMITNEAYVSNLRERFPEARESLLKVEIPGGIWWADPHEADYLVERIGSGTIPNPSLIELPQRQVQVEEDPLIVRSYEIKERYELLEHVPITINLKTFHKICLITEPGAIKEALLLLARLAIANPYSRLKFVLVYDERRSCYASLKALRWLPHLWSDDRKLRYMITDSASAGSVGYELVNIFRDREGTGISKEAGCKYVFFIFSSELILKEPLWDYLTRRQEDLGYRSFFLYERGTVMPYFCQMSIEAGIEGKIREYKSQKEQSFVYDSFESEWLFDTVPYLAGLKLEEESKDSGLLDSISFLNLYGVRHVEDLDVSNRWKKNRTYDHIDGILGVKAGGAMCILDMHERYHGPHGLIAGTTGSGKSETLQSYILSLAIQFSPEDVAFFLIDYKGGGMAHLFEGLPHMAGEISNLSGSQIKRAMVSIKSENMRRQRMFRDHDVNNINAYTRAYKAGEIKRPIPHLFIIVDEFAELKREEPEFLQELISVAQVGRSLGVHLILSTQKPSGTVDDNIWSNSRFHICLRVQNAADSMDMLHKPDAATITNAGRGYLQVGNDEVYELFQSGYSGASYDENNQDYSELLYGLSLSGQKLALKQEKKGSGEMVTQLMAVKEYLKELALSLNMFQPVTLWMPELKKEIFYKDLFIKEAGGRDISLPFGMIDDVEHQTQETYTISIEEAGHMAVIGGVSSGKSTMLETIVYGLLLKYSPKEVNVYIIDYNSHKLSAFLEAPQVGAILHEYEDKNLKRMLHMIQLELRRRKKILGGGSFLQYIEKHEGTLPYIILIVDGYENFRNQTEDLYEDLFIQVSKEGLSCGIHLILTGGSFSYMDIPSRISDNITTVIPLQLNDRFEYMEYFHVFGLELCPALGIPGRGLIRTEDRILEFQAALALEAAGDFERMEDLREFASLQKLLHPEDHAPKIPQVPERLIWKSYVKLERFKEAMEELDGLVLGFDEELGSLSKIAFSSFYCMIIWGEGGSGKTNLMKVCMKTLLLGNFKKTIYLFEDGRDDYGSFREEEAITYINSYEDANAYLLEIIDEFIRRNRLKNQWIDEGIGDRDLFARMNREIPMFVFMGNVKELLGYLRKHCEKTYVILINIMEKGFLHHIYFFCDANLSDAYHLMEDEVFCAMASYQTGIHLGKNAVLNNQLLFKGLSYDAREISRKVGTGILSMGENASVILVTPEIRE